MKKFKKMNQKKSGKTIMSSVHVIQGIALRLPAPFATTAGGQELTS
jgi:hypothetical protein